MAITNKVTGASAMWQGSPGLLGLLSTPGYDGGGIGVAVLDSGISSHSALDSRVIARVNLVSWEGATSGDPYGHGTHVAGIIAGNTTAAKYVTPAFAGGSAPGVSLIDVRVLGTTGVGYTSDVIAGIDWAVANRAQYGIRVINLSLGHEGEAIAIDEMVVRRFRVQVKGDEVGVPDGRREVGRHLLERPGVARRRCPSAWNTRHCYNGYARSSTKCRV